MAPHSSGSCKLHQDDRWEVGYPRKKCVHRLQRGWGGLSDRPVSAIYSNGSPLYAAQAL